MLMTASDVASIAKPWEVQHKVTSARLKRSASDILSVLTTKKNIAAMTIDQGCFWQSLFLQCIFKGTVRPD
jgi:hypothetical protein